MRVRHVLLLLCLPGLLLATLAPQASRRAEADPSNQLIVAFDSQASASERSRAHRASAGTLVRRIPELHVDVVEVSERDEESARDSYGRSRRVRYVDQSQPLTTYALPNDPRFDQQWGLHNVGQGAGFVADADIDAPPAWDSTTGGNVAVAVIDTGARLDHPDLAPNVAGSIGSGCTSNAGGGPCGHGTHVSGIAAARGNNGIGVSGVGPTVRLLNVPFDFSDVGGAAAITSAANWSRDNSMPVVVNASWGRSGACPQILGDAISYARSLGVLVVAAAGNSGRSNDAGSDTPSGCPYDNVIAVAASDPSDNLAWFSNFGGASVDLAAPGEDIYSTLLPQGADFTNAYGKMSGTSMAAPMVAGAAALVWAANPSLPRNAAGATAVRQRLLESVDALPPLGCLVVTGGRLNVGRALGQVPANPPASNPWARAGEGAAALSGAWRASSSGGNTCGAAGALRSSRAAGDAASLVFSGTGIRWDAQTNPNGGITNVFLDGQLVGARDLYSASVVTGTVFEQTGLTPGVHTLQLVVTGQRNPASRNTYTYVDGFQILDGAVATRTEESGAGLNGAWRSVRDSYASSGSMARSTTNGATATFTFSGTTVRWLGSMQRASGVAEVIVDGVSRGQVTGTSSRKVAQAVLFQLTLPHAGVHTITFVNRPMANGRIGSLFVDAIETL